MSDNIFIGETKIKVLSIKTLLKILKDKEYRDNAFYEWTIFFYVIIKKIESKEDIFFLHPEKTIVKERRLQCLEEIKSLLTKKGITSFLNECTILERIINKEV